MNSTASKLTAVLLSVFLLGYVGYQAFTSLYNPYESEIVKQGEYVHDIDLNGFFVRNEKVLEENKHGVISYKFKNAEKISKDTTVANIYERESDLYNLNKISELEHKKNILLNSQNKQNIQGSKLDVLNNQINKKQLDLIKRIDEGNLSSINRIYDDLMLSMNQIKVCIDNTINFNQSIDNIDKQIVQLKTEISDNSITVNSNESGYFTNTTDGYEDIFTLDMIKQFNVDDVKKYIDNQKTKPTASIGKIQYDAGWSFVSIVKTKMIDSFKVNQEITLKFNSKSTKEVKATVSKIITAKDNENSVIVLSSDYLDEDFVTMRFEKPKAIINNLFGIIIPKEAIRVEKDVKGVYTLLDKSVRFKKVDALYEDNYVVISKPNVKPDYVTVYDKVIIKGKNLHESAR